jgi:hypothetical protein
MLGYSCKKYNDEILLKFFEKFFTLFSKKFRKKMEQYSAI